MDELVQNLEMMGYRLLGVKATPVYAKPFGYTLFTVALTEPPVFKQHFKGANGQQLVWTSVPYKDTEPFLGWLKYCENWHSKNSLGCGNDSEYEFMQTHGVL